MFMMLNHQQDFKVSALFFFSVQATTLIIHDQSLIHSGYWVFGICMVDSTELHKNTVLSNTHL